MTKSNRFALLCRCALYTLLHIFSKPSLFIGDGLCVVHRGSKTQQLLHNSHHPPFPWAQSLPQPRTHPSAGGMAGKRSFHLLLPRSHPLRLSLRLLPSIWPTPTWSPVGGIASLSPLCTASLSVTFNFSSTAAAQCQHVQGAGVD